MTSSSILIGMRVLTGEGIPAPRLPRPGRRLPGDGLQVGRDSVLDRIHQDIYCLYIFNNDQGACVKTAKLFKNGDSQAVRLPKEFRFAGAEVLIKRVGSAVVLLPKAKSWDTLVQSLDKFPADFMNEREQPREAERREPLQ